MTFGTACSATGSGTGHLIDYTFVNAVKSTGKNGAAPGGHADDAEGDNLNYTHPEYGKEYVGRASTPTARRRWRFWPWSATGASAT